ncbi:MAG TPA: adenylate/guanylate cyclase domain-containing protein [Anaerolineales bacterium]
MDEREEIVQAIKSIEEQRSTLGSAAVDAALEGLRQRLESLGQPPDARSSQPETPAYADERKLVTVLFADISGFTALSEKTDPEVIRGQINAWFTHLVPVIQNFGGTVEKFIGDEIMAFFGAPVAHENDAELGLLAALGLMKNLEEFNAQKSVKFKIHIGVNTGLVVSGKIGAPGQQQYGVTGDAVNLASRLANLAEGGQIFAGPDTYRLTAPLFDFKMMEPTRIKGKAEPVPVYQLIGVQARPGRVRGLETRGVHSPLVGRQAELATASSCVDRLLRGEGGILSIIGEAGLGKSRLVAELHAETLRRTGQPPIWLEGQTLSFGQMISYWPFKKILFHWAGISDQDGEEAAWLKLESSTRELFGEQAVDLLPFIASLLGMEVRDEYVQRVQYLDNEAMGKQILLAMLRFFERLAAQHPTVLEFEDLHWMDASSAALLEKLLPLVETAPLLVIGISRPVQESPAGRLRAVLQDSHPDRYREIRLSPLTEAESKELIGNLLEIKEAPQVDKAISAKAEGNPFYIEEVIRTLIETGAVKRDATARRWQTTAKVESIKIPDTIQGVILARVDALEEPVKQVLRVAAVIGRSFLYRVLKAVCGTNGQLDDDLTKLKQIELINQKQPAAELEFVFNHTLAHEAVYESILLQTRRELHTRVGQAIEALFTDRLDEFYGLLAYHYARAEQWEKAQAYLVKAGDQAGRVAADAEALSHYRQAMEAYGRVFGDRWDPLERAVLERKIGEALMRRGENTSALETFELALAHLGKPVHGTKSAIRQAILFEIATQAAHRMFPRLYEPRTGGEFSQKVVEEARLYFDMGTITARVNQEQFLFDVLRGLNFAEQKKYAHGVCRGAAGFGLICDFIPIFKLAQFYHRQAVHLAEQMQNPVSLGIAYFGLGLDQAIQGKYTPAEESCLRSAQYFLEAGEITRWGLTVETLGQVLIYEDKFQQALAYAEDMIRIGQESAGTEMLCICNGRMLQGMVERRMEQTEAAVTHLQEAIELASANPDYYTLTFAAGELGLTHLGQGRLEQALEALEIGQQTSKDHKIRGNALSPVYHGLAQAYLLSVQRSSLSERKVWLQRAGQACRTAIGQGKAFLGGMPEAMRLQGRYEWLAGQPNAALSWWQRSLASAEQMGMGYELAMTYLEIGQSTGEPAQVEIAKSLLAEIGIGYDKGSYEPHPA